MSLETIKINGIILDVYFTHTAEKDPFGTGDSPTLHNVELVAVETPTDTINLIPILCDSIIEKIEEEIFSMVQEY